MEGDTADFDTSADEPRQKKGRHRKKQLYNSILSQMEFYFSDSNLAKDRFLSQQIKEDPNVELSTFLKFNKLCKLTTSLDDIRKALTKSTLLQVSEDGSTVFRKTPVKEPVNVEERTIYVERLKGDATHDWVTSVFSEFGKVVYVSIPKYKDKNENKGFAFIEFETEAEAENALSYFESIDCKIPQNADPEKVQSLAVYNEVGNGTDSGPKRKAKDDGEAPPAKKVKTEGNPEPQVDESKEDNKGEENKKKRKLKKENKKRAHIKELDLRVLSKREWRKMRNRYIDLQRKKMKEFKQHLAKQKYSRTPNYGDGRTPNYGDEVFKKPIEASEQIEDTAKKIEFVPGVIAKIKLDEPCLEPKKLKNEVRNASTEIQFVEVLRPPTDDEVYVRFANAKACEEFAGQPYNGSKVEILKGDEEKIYWDKVFKDREEKLKKVQEKQKKERGRDKLLRKANKLIPQHMKFDD